MARDLVDPQQLGAILVPPVALLVEQDVGCGAVWHLLACVTLHQTLVALQNPLVLDDSTRIIFLQLFRLLFAFTRFSCEEGGAITNTR